MISGVAANSESLDSLAASQTSRELRVHVAMLGARQHYAVPKLLQESGMLGRFYTDLYARDNRWAVRFLSAMPRALRPKTVERYLTRSEIRLRADKVVSFDRFGLWYVWKVRRARNAQARNRAYAEGAQSFNRKVIEYGLPGADVLYGYNGASLELFEYAKTQGIRCILEQTIAPQKVVRQLLREEAERWPGWEDASVPDSEDCIIDAREEKEWKLADLIVGGSTFVIEELEEQEVAADKCRIVPYGVSLDQFSPKPTSEFSADSKLRILFAGGVGLRKGAPYLLQALRLLNSSHIEARFAGPVGLDRSRLKPYKLFAKFLGSVSRNHMVDLYRWADVFVLPSICEGSALATYEAMASGVPVISTRNTGAWMREGVDGIMVPTRDVEALAGALERFVLDKKFLRFCGQNVRAVRHRMGLEAYRKRLVDSVKELDVRRVKNARF